MYKLHPLDPGAVIVIETGACIPNDPRNVDWVRYQQWLAKGNTVAPSRTRAEQQEYVAELIEAEADRRIDAATSANPRDKRKSLAHAIRLIRKEAKGNASPEDVAALDKQEAVADHIDAVESLSDSSALWIRSEVPTNVELEDFDPVNDISWPTPPEG